ncbi:hypothetical protein C5O19_24115 [Siphonobacter curvatus]|uniref:Uncharacterized protein n=1 Tax=Siphonobacter curvatus TaxID=2094562 RepID=A0A2S7IF79_9BACT|nr:hypothetical protein C5O19_24115 [Siphonobacter curvatus]
MQETIGVIPTPFGPCKKVPKNAFFFFKKFLVSPAESPNFVDSSAPMLNPNGLNEAVFNGYSPTLIISVLLAAIM